MPRISARNMRPNESQSESNCSAASELPNFSLWARRRWVSTSFNDLSVSEEVDMRALAVAPITLCDVSGDGYSGSPRLRCQTEEFLSRELAGKPVASFHERHALLPNLEIAIGLDFAHSTIILLPTAYCLLPTNSPFHPPAAAAPPKGSGSRIGGTLAGDARARSARASLPRRSGPRRSRSSGSPCAAGAPRSRSR